MTVARGSVLDNGARGICALHYGEDARLALRNCTLFPLKVESAIETVDEGGERLRLEITEPPRVGEQAEPDCPALDAAALDQVV